MFQGIIYHRARVFSFDKINNIKVLTLEFPSDFDVSDVKLGDSIAVNGCCLTVTSIAENNLSFDLLDETLRATNFQFLNKADEVNIEKACRLSDAVNGHILSGHVDAYVEFIEAVGEDHWFKLNETVKPYIVKKGSVAINGVSLTVGEVLNDRFCVYLIPKTLELTNLSLLNTSKFVNIEIDMLARYCMNFINNLK